METLRKNGFILIPDSSGHFVGFCHFIHLAQPAIAA
jgi:hypothetical protein